MTSQQLEDLVDTWVDLMANSAHWLDPDTVIVGTEVQTRGIVLLIQSAQEDPHPTPRRVLVTARELKKG